MHSLYARTHLKIAMPKTQVLVVVVVVVVVVAAMTVEWTITMVPDFSVVVVGIRSLSTFLQLEMHLET
jgi:hypothetical protein